MSDGGWDEDTSAQVSWLVNSACWLYYASIFRALGLEVETVVSLPRAEGLVEAEVAGEALAVSEGS